MALGVEEAVWTFLRIDPSFISGIFINDIVNLIILPSIILIIFLDFVVCRFLRESTGRQNLGHILSVALFMVIIVQGWYGPFAMFAKSYIILFLMLAVILFVLNRIFSGGEESHAAEKVGGILEKHRIIRGIDDELDEKRQRLRNLHNAFHAPGTDRDAQAEIARQIGDCKNKIAELEKKRRDLKRIL